MVNTSISPSAPPLESLPSSSVPTFIRKINIPDTIHKINEKKGFNLEDFIILIGIGFIIYCIITDCLLSNKKDYSNGTLDNTSLQYSEQQNMKENKVLEVVEEENEEVNEEENIEKNFENRILDSDKKLLDMYLSQYNTPKELVNKVLHDGVSDSKNFMTTQYGSYSNIYKKLVEKQMKNLHSENELLKLDLTKTLSLRQQNQKRKVFLEVLLIQLLRKMSVLENIVKEQSQKGNLLSKRYRNMLVLNKLLQNRIEQIKQEQNKVEQERGMLNTLGQKYSVIKLGPKMANELNNMNLLNNVPKEVRDSVHNNPKVLHILRL